MNSTTKKRAISDVLRQEIVDGKFSDTRRLPSEHQLMRRFSVARETIRGVIKDLIDSKLVDRRKGFGSFLVDRATSRATARFGVIVPDAYHSFYQKICRGIEDEARVKGWSVFSAAIGAGDPRERAIKAVEFAEICRDQKVGGVFFQPLQFFEDDESFNRSLLKILDEANIPVVLLDSDFTEAPKRSGYDLVGIDNCETGYMLGQHLVERGAKRIVYFSNRNPSRTSLRRGEGVWMAAQKAGLKWTRENTIFANPRDPKTIRKHFCGALRPDAVVCVNDLIARWLCDSLHEVGLSVPRDVMVAGVNGDGDSECSIPPLTTAAQPCHEIGQIAVKMMLDRIAEPGLAPRGVYLSTRLIERESTMRSAPGCGKSRKGRKGK
jgi:LacI family transcriptional regulator